jgi:hypothetical protein
MSRRQVDAFVQSRDALGATHLSIGRAEGDEGVRLDSQRPLFPRHVDGGPAPLSRRGKVEIQVGEPRDHRVSAGQVLTLSEGLEELHRILGRGSRRARLAEPPPQAGDACERPARALGIARFVEPSPGLFGRAESMAWLRGELCGFGKAQLKVAERGFIVSGQFDGALEMPRRAREREQTIGLARGEVAITEGPFAITALIEVVRELFGMRRGIRAGARLDRLADDGVHTPPFALEEVEQDAFARESVTEGIALAPLLIRPLDDELRVDRRTQGPNEARIFGAGHAAQEVEVELLADDRGLPEDVLGLRRQGREALKDRVPQGVGDCNLGDVLGRPPLPVAELDIPALDERAEHLFHEERIAFAAVEHRLAELGARRPA